MTNEARSPSTVKALQLLPEFDPQPALWTRIEGLRERHVSRRRRRRVSLLGMSIAASFLAVVIFIAGFRAQQPQQADLSGWQRESLTLEARWRESSGKAPDARARSQLQLIDAQLQAAYDQAATATVLIPLWKQRNETLRELVEHDGRGVRSITRI